MWKRRFRARLPSDFESSSGESEAWTVSSTAGLIWEWSRSKQTCSETVRGTRFPINLLKHVLSCKTQHFVHPPTLKNRFRARLPSTSESWRCESEAFVRDSFKIWKWKMRKRSFRARRPSQSESWRCENEAFVQDFLQNLQVEYVRTKLSCETSLKTWKLKMWERSFRARLPSKSESGRCGNEAFVRDLPQNLKVEDVKTKRLCESSPKTSKWKRSFRARLPFKSESWRCGSESFVRDFLFIIQSFNANSIQFSSIQLSSIQFSSVQFNSIHSIQFKSVQGNSSQFIQFNSNQFNSVQFNSTQFNSFLHSLILVNHKYP